MLPNSVPMAELARGIRPTAPHPTRSHRNRSVCRPTVTDRCSVRLLAVAANDDVGVIDLSLPRWITLISGLVASTPR